MLNDLLAIRRIKDGDIKVFESIFRRYYSPLLYFSMGITGSSAASEEVIQDLFYVLWRDKERLNITTSLKSYLYTSVKNRSIQYCEHERVVERYKNYKSTDHVQESPAADDSIEYKEVEKILQRAISNMPDRMAKIFKMHRFDSKKYSEIAELLSVSVKTVEAEMTKAIKRLKRELETYLSIS